MRGVVIGARAEWLGGPSYTVAQTCNYLGLYIIPASYHSAPWVSLSLHFTPILRLCPYLAGSVRSLQLHQRQGCVIKSTIR